MPRSKNTLPVSIDPADYGPAMAALPSPRMQQFVIGKIINGMDNAAACRFAGYSAGAVSRRAWELAHDPRVIEAQLELTKLIFRSQGPRNLATLMEIRDDKTAAARDRLRAVEMIMN